MYHILNATEIDNYIDHVSNNPANSRVSDNELIPKIRTGLANHPRIITFVDKDETGNIVASMMTKPRNDSLEYFILNYRTGRDTFFSKHRMMGMFDYVFQHYENRGFYKWLTARPIDLLNPRHFRVMKDVTPFNRYVTAIEFMPGRMAPVDGSIYIPELLSGIPDSKTISDYFIISGFCKQEYRALTQTMANYYV